MGAAGSIPVAARDYRHRHNVQEQSIDTSCIQYNLRFFYNLVGEEGPRIPGVKDPRVCFLKTLLALLAFFRFSTKIQLGRDSSIRTMALDCREYLDIKINRFIFTRWKQHRTYD